MPERNETAQRHPVLVTGGAGYIGSVLVGRLLDAGYPVRALDSLLWGGQSMIQYFADPNFDFLSGDVRDTATVQRALAGCESVVHLAAIVGDPACAKAPEVAAEVNLAASKTLYRLAAEAGLSRFIFSSTCSNYGKMADQDSYVSEASELRPVSHYGRLKTEFDRYLLNQTAPRCVPTCLRFATVYGVSPRMRFDLTVNEFTRDLALGRELVVYGEQFWRPYCHVIDICRGVMTALQAPMSACHDAFNVGDTDENYTKGMLLQAIQAQVDSGTIARVEKNEDPRDYRVSFSHIRTRLDFHVTRRVPDGVAEIVRLVRSGAIPDPDAACYRNV